MMKLEIRLPISNPSHSGIFSGDNASVSSTATALVMIPVATSAADQLAVSARPVLMSLCVAAAVAFLTPVSTPANMMVMGPAGYRFGDYWKLGLPLVVLFGIVAVVLVPLVWRF